jgi:hypothetical protein
MVAHNQLTDDPRPRADRCPAPAVYRAHAARARFVPIPAGDTPEKSRQPVLLDERQLPLQPVARAVSDLLRLCVVLPPECALADPAQVAVERGPLWHGIVRQPVGQVFRQVESAALRDRQRVRHRPRIPLEPQRHLILVLQEELRVRPPHLMRAVERQPVPYRHQHIVHPVSPPHVVVRVIGGHHLDPHPLRQLRHRRHPRRVPKHIVVLQLDVKPLPKDISVARRDSVSRLHVVAALRGRARAVCIQELRDLALPAPRQHHQPLV